ncbi:glycosyltransferase [bacterium]|nr:glycosyltransferase [bacterium]
MTENRRVDLSIVVPVFNERSRLAWGLEEIVNFLRAAPIASEVIVVDDGSADGTADAAIELLDGRVAFEVIRVPENRGKGHAVKIGMLRSRGAVRLFTDIDISVPIDTATEFFRCVSEGADVVIGTRKVAESQVMVHQPYYRESLGGVFRWISRVLCAPPVTDFTCGFKAFSARATGAIFTQSVIPRWSFDAEILFLAYRMGFRIVQLPVTWYDSRESKVRLGVDTVRSFVELLQIRVHQIAGRYIIAKSYQGHLERAPRASAARTPADTHAPGDERKSA